MGWGGGGGGVKTALLLPPPTPRGVCTQALAYFPRRTPQVTLACSDNWAVTLWTSVCAGPAGLPLHGGRSPGLGNGRLVRSLAGSQGGDSSTVWTALPTQGMTPADGEYRQWCLTGLLIWQEGSGSFLGQTAAVPVHCEK